MSSIATIHLKSGREKSLRHRHPWIFSGAVQSVSGEAGPGDIVKVVDASMQFLAYAYYNEKSNIRARVLSWVEGTTVDEDWWGRGIEAAIARRSPLAGAAGTDAYRLVYSEADLLPGLVVDRYGDFLVTQFLTAGAERMRSVVVDKLQAALRPAGIVDRSDTDTRKREGMEQTSGVIAGDAPGVAEFTENGVRYQADLIAGQKTGFYLDQRDNRRAVAELAPGRRVLDAFAYTGSFSVCAMLAGARSCTLADSSHSALETARENMALNDVDPEAATFIRADVFDLLREYRAQGEKFDLVILDPPKFARNKNQANRAMRGYKDINLLAMQILNPDGILATFSCSAGVSAESFALCVAWAGLDAERDVQILRRLGQGIDHPVLAAFPESEYLKGLVCRIS